jgi:hypothetical protein
MQVNACSQYARQLLSWIPDDVTHRKGPSTRENGPRRGRADYPATGASPRGRKDQKMGKSRRRLCWDNAVRVLKQLLGIAAELVSVINAIRNVR